MKYCLLTLLPAALFAQSTTVTYVVDINGHRVESAASATGKTGEKTEVTQSINGRRVPLEQIETHVLSETPNEKVTETFDRKYDQTGALASTERTLTTERKTPSGGSLTNATIYRSDVNGGMQEAERRTIETRPQASMGMRPAGLVATESDVSIARPSAGGGFETVEQRKIVKVEDPNHSHEEQTIFLKSTNGDFAPRRRTVAGSKKSGEKTDATLANYETDYAGRVALLNQETSTTVTSKDGKQVVERNIYAAASDAVTRSERDVQRVNEQQTIVRTPNADGSVTEKISVRRPTLGDPTHLGDPSQLSETVCTGKCDIPKP